MVSTTELYHKGSGGVAAPAVWKCYWLSMRRFKVFSRSDSPA